MGNKMKTLEINGNTGNSTIYINKPFTYAKKLLKGERIIIITDENVKGLYEDKFPSGDIITIGKGEGIKTLQTVEDIYKKLMDLEFDRSGFILGIGGGIVCDVAGFAASTYMRGVRFGFIASTLLAQVDASVGGKNGVNLEGHKNMVGVFSQPEFVLCDPEMLKTLPAKELKNGFAEITKHALIGDRNLFEFMEQNHKSALGLDPDVIGRLTHDSLVLKSGIVNRDEKEKGERRKLNFGHTIAHALEKTMNLSHGEAVSVGMGISAKLSVKMSDLSAEGEKRIYELFKKFDLNQNIKISCSGIKKAVRRDKKREGDNINFILLKKIGEAIIEKIPIKVLEGVIDDMC